MSTKMSIKFDVPILYGCISTAKSQCGNPNCICKRDNKKFHGPYYRWTGLINGKRTTKTISKEEAQECMKRIKRYHVLEKEIQKLLEQSIKNAPWCNKKER